MRTNRGGGLDARAALDAVKEGLAGKVAPKLERLRAAEGEARGLRQEVAGLNETVEELAAEVAQVRRVVRGIRKKRTLLTAEGGD